MTTTLTIYNPQWRDWHESCELRQAANRGDFRRMLQIMDARMMRALQIPAGLIGVAYSSTILSVGTNRTG